MAVVVIVAIRSTCNLFGTRQPRNLTQVPLRREKLGIVDETASLFLNSAPCCGLSFIQPSVCLTWHKPGNKLSFSAWVNIKKLVYGRIYIVYTVRMPAESNSRP